MRERRGLERVEDLCSGPGKLTQALGIGLDLNGTALGRADQDRAAPAGAEPVVAGGARIGITRRWTCRGASATLEPRVSRPWPPAMRRGRGGPSRGEAPPPWPPTGCGAGGRRRRWAGAAARAWAPARGGCCGPAGVASALGRLGSRRLGRRRPRVAGLPCPCGADGLAGAYGTSSGPRRRPSCRSRPRAARGCRSRTHEVVPDLGREGAAGHRAAAVLGLHVAAACRGSRPRPPPSAPC